MHDEFLIVRVEPGPGEDEAVILYQPNTPGIRTKPHWNGYQGQVAAWVRMAGVGERQRNDFSSLVMAQEES